MVSRLEEIDTVVTHEVDEAMFLGETPRPHIRPQVPEGFWLAESPKRFVHDGIDQIDDLGRHLAILLDPVPKVFAKLVLKDAVSTVSRADGTHP